jgi:3'(2'), 5'-bisphosphate nucleotidase
LWLVDPLDGREAFAAGRDDFSVNLALVEDGEPIYGVVHAPAQGVTYFGRKGKGAFRRVLGGERVRLPAAADRHGHDHAKAAVYRGDKADSHALVICACLEHDVEAVSMLPPVDEWRAAAGQAVVGASGAGSLIAADGAEPTYNSEHLQVEAHRFVAKVVV